MDSGSVLKLPTWVRVLKIDINKNVLVREIRFDYKESKVDTICLFLYFHFLISPVDEFYHVDFTSADQDPRGR